MSVESINDHMALSCDCGSVHFNLLKSGNIECAGCQESKSKKWKHKMSHDQISLEQLLKDGGDYLVSVQEITDKGIHFIIHPHGKNGETLDFVAKSNIICPLSSANDKINLTG